MDVLLPPLHPGQRGIAEHAALPCWPAGAAGENQAGRGAVRGGGPPPGRAWWVAPSYKMAAVGWRLVRQLGQQVPGAQIKGGPDGATARRRHGAGPLCG